MSAWKVLVVDDEEGIHGITRMIFRDYQFEQRPIQLISAKSSAEARQLLEQHPDLALVLLDVVMETDHSGLHLVDHIRNELGNRDIRVILRTGHPGFAPESQVIVDYDINDYLSKAELSASRLLTSVVVALRSYRDIINARQQAPQPTPIPGSADQSQQRLVERLLQRFEPMLKQSRRLSSMELNPVAMDLASGIHGQQQRLHNLICLLDQQPGAVKSQLVDLTPLLDQALNCFLPQSRNEGWLVDYRLDSSLSAQLQTDPQLLSLLLISLIELALQQAGGSDLLLRLQNTDSQQLQISLSHDRLEAPLSPWALQLQQQLQRLSSALGGEFRQDPSGLYCLIRA